MVAPAGRSRAATNTVRLSDAEVQNAIEPRTATAAMTIPKNERASSRRGARSARAGVSVVATTVGPFECFRRPPLRGAYLWRLHKEGRSASGYVFVQTECQEVATSSQSV